MKKVLISALTLIAALAVDAAAFDWRISDATVDNDGYKIYAIIGNTVATSWASIDALVSASIGSAALGTVSKIGRDYVAGGTAIDDSIKSDKNFYLVIVDASSTKFASSQVYDAKTYVYTPPDSGTPVATFSMAGLSYTNFGTEPIPEPTSGLLVLVGLAGLMLRRKRT